MNDRIERLLETLEIELALRGAPEAVFEKLHALAQTIEEPDAVDWLGRALELIREEQERRGQE